MPTVWHEGDIIAAANRIAQEPEYGSNIRWLSLMPQILHSENAAIGSNGVVVTQIRVTGAMEKI